MGREWHPTTVLLPGKSHGRRAWWAVVHGVARSWTRLSDFTFTFHFHTLEKDMATHSSVLAWRIPGMGEPGELSSMGSHRVGHDWSDLAAAVAVDGRSTWNSVIWRGGVALLAGVFVLPDFSSLPHLHTHVFIILYSSRCILRVGKDKNQQLAAFCCSLIYFSFIQSMNVAIQGSSFHCLCLILNIFPWTAITWPPRNVYITEVNFWPPWAS